MRTLLLLLVSLLLYSQSLRERAANGNPEAQFTLGKNYEAGRGGLRKDYAEAARWYLKSAVQGNVYAQASLGILYHAGKGVPQDLVQAEMWFLIAADHSAEGDRDTIVEMRDSVAAHLTPQQLAEAKRLAHEWTPK
ncbi:MAG: tetratricopeptide repeat protein [Bryobacteraceae bacterium]